MWRVQGIFIVLEKEARLIQPWKLNHSIKAETSTAWIAEVQAASAALTAKLHQSWPRGMDLGIRVALHLSSCTELGLTECLSAVPAAWRGQLPTGDGVDPSP